MEHLLIAIVSGIIIILLVIVEELFVKYRLKRRSIVGLSYATEIVYKGGRRCKNTTLAADDQLAGEPDLDRAAGAVWQSSDAWGRSEL
ncbi:hypothetical protein CLV58_1368 [Spirosoma oryzae]|uniref:Uncharacterized protein n=1 Tax=Spirosoma oryzae TaxID=1469603 RepID=A0A2T0RXW0_9BACT|nr:hypothetical protein [Spirosoma oryzae]PRY25873.1 hypothetical protein CLV58_1368 [Spirosoma oryzae]